MWGFTYRLIKFFSWPFQAFSCSWFTSWVMNVCFSRVHHFKTPANQKYANLCCMFSLEVIWANLIITSRFQALISSVLCLVFISYILEAAPCKFKPINELQKLRLNWIHMTKPTQIPLIQFQLPHWWTERYLVPPKNCHEQDCVQKRNLQRSKTAMLHQHTTQSPCLTVPMKRLS